MGQIGVNELGRRLRGGLIQRRSKLLYKKVLYNWGCSVSQVKLIMGVFGFGLDKN